MEEKVQDWVERTRAKMRGTKGKIKTTDQQVRGLKGAQGQGSRLVVKVMLLYASQAWSFHI